MRRTVARTNTRTKTKTRAENVARKGLRILNERKAAKRARERASVPVPSRPVPRAVPAVPVAVPRRTIGCSDDDLCFCALCLGLGIRQP